MNFAEIVVPARECSHERTVFLSQIHRIDDVVLEVRRIKLETRTVGDAIRFSYPGGVPYINENNGVGYPLCFNSPVNLIGNPPVVTGIFFNKRGQGEGNHIKNTQK